MSTEEQPMTGRVCLVTGATAGVGKETARELARQGAEVVVVGRNPEKTRATVEAIRAATGNRAVSSLLADLSLQTEARRLAEEFRGRYPRIDVLINNAGAFFAQKKETSEGIERTFALNHLAPFLLTNLLLDRLTASAPARVVTVASEAHRGFRLDLDTIANPSKYNGLKAYSYSKLANILFTIELARRLEGTGVTANALHPGFVRSEFFEGNGRIGWLARQISRVAAISPEAGSRTSVYLATSPDVAYITGGYFDKRKPAKASAAARDTTTARELWLLSERLTGLSLSSTVS